MDTAKDSALRTKVTGGLRTGTALAVAGLVLLACDLQSHYLLMPYALEDLSRILYRLAFFIVLPFRAVTIFFIPSVDHHWPLAHHIVTCMGTPCFLYGLRCALLRLVRRRSERRARAEEVADNPALIERRQFLMRSAAGAVGVASGGLGGYASIVAPEILHVRRYDIPIKGLPAALEGLRIVHVSDTHYGPFVSMPYLEKVFERVNALQPDLVALTGDYVHYTPDSVNPGIGALAVLEGRLGVVAVMGNHEHWEGAEACRARFQSIGLPLVDNARLFLTARGLESAPTPDALCVAGVGDLWEDEVSFEKALANVPEDMPRLVLSHNPDAAERVTPDRRVDLMLSGHTHGGQIALPLIGPPIAPSEYGFKYLGGLCQGPHNPVIVSRGVGLAGIPLRFGVPPEVGLITLHRA